MSAHVCDGDQCPLEYLQSLQEAGFLYANLQRLKAWKSAFQLWTESGRLYSPHIPLVTKKERLPKLLALVHPKFRFSGSGEAFQLTHMIYRGADAAWKKHSSRQHCQSEMTFGVECPFQDRTVRHPELEADHVWPKSLGGPWEASNRMWLCPLHNQMKGNCIFHYSWSQYPAWLDHLLQELHRFAR